MQTPIRFATTAVFVLAVLLTACSEASPPPQSSSQPTAAQSSQTDPTPTPVPTPSNFPTATPTPEPTPSPYPTATPIPTPEPTSTPTPTPTPPPTATPEPTPTPSPTPTATPPPTPTPEPTATPEPTPTPKPVLYPLEPRADFGVVSIEIPSDFVLAKPAENEGGSSFHQYKATYRAPDHSTYIQIRHIRALYGWKTGFNLEKANELDIQEIKGGYSPSAQVTNSNSVSKQAIRFGFTANPPGSCSITGHGQTTFTGISWTFISTTVCDHSTEIFNEEAFVGKVFDSLRYLY